MTMTFRGSRVGPAMGFTLMELLLASGLGAVFCGVLLQLSLIHISEPTRPY